jgi:hypothetical protein
MDRYWYHPLLLGSVRHGEHIEKLMNRTLPTIALTSVIGTESGGAGLSKRRSSRWMMIFYGAIAIVLVGLALALLFGQGNKISQTTTTPSIDGHTAPNKTSPETGSPSPKSDGF